jgi:hypothetical protein
MVEIIRARTNRREAVKPNDMNTTAWICYQIGTTNASLEVVTLKDGRLLAYGMDGYAKRLTFNPAATSLLHRTIPTDVRVYGDAILFDQEEVAAPTPEEEESLP